MSTTVKGLLTSLILTVAHIITLIEGALQGLQASHFAFPTAEGAGV